MQGNFWIKRETIYYLPSFTFYHFIFWEWKYIWLEEINKLKDEADLERVKIIGVDGATDYIRPVINKLDDEDFEVYKNYQLSICERPELMGASSHIMDILTKK